MNFEEWYENWPDKNLYDLNDPHPATKDAWNAAIDEAAKVAKEGHTYTPTSTAHNIAKRIKELKE